MSNLTKQIQKLNKICYIMKEQYSILKKMFHNHKQIVDTISLSESILHQAYGLIVEKTEEVASKREFNKIIKQLKNDKNK